MMEAGEIRSEARPRQMTGYDAPAGRSPPGYRGLRPPLFSRGAYRWLATAFVLVSLAACWFSGLPSLVYYIAASARATGSGKGGLALDSYRVVLEAQPIAGLRRNLSGLTYSDATGTLFAVVNRPAEIAELSTDGRLLRKIAVSGVSDPEGITHIGDGRFIISDEASQSLHWVDIAPQTTEVDITDGSRLRLDIGGFQNMGLEGLSWDARNRHLYVTQEMLPSRIIVIEGLADGMAGNDVRLTAGEWKQRGLASLFLLDLSSASLHERTGNLVLLSHMSSMLVEHERDGTVVSALPLWSGFNGLEHSIAQAEGVAFGPDDDIFIVAEPNLFYRFARGNPATRARTGLPFERGP